MMRAPDQIEGYTIERKLTEGGMAEVYLAHHDVEGLDRRVVIKSLLPALAGNTEYVAMLVNEARIAASLSHPNIVRVEDLVEVGGRPFIVMEYLDGENLRQIVYRALQQKRSLSLAFVCAAIARVLDGLGHAHDLADAGGSALGLVHRDVSLANVIVTWSGRVKLIDFGIAKETSAADRELTQAGQLKGKSAYMSPEQIRRQPLDRRSDVFSVGVVLWEMLTQRRLFARKSEVDSMMAICGHDAPPPSSAVPGLPAALDRICAKALAREPGERYQSAAEMCADLEALMAAEGWSASPYQMQAELASLFPVESVEAEDARARPLYGALSDDDDDDDTPKIMALPPAPPPRERRRLRASPPTTLRTAELSLFNRQLPGPSVYDDFYAAPRTGVGDRLRGHAALLVVLVSCLLLIAMATLVHR